MLREAVTLAAVVVALWGFSTLILAATAASRQRKAARRAYPRVTRPKRNDPYDV